MQILQYNLTHPYPRNKLFTTATIIAIVIALPILVMVNIITVGHELVPSLQPSFEPNTTVNSWWATTPLAPLLRLKAPRCQPKDFGRGDTFRLSPSLFEYKVLSSWRSNGTLTSKDEGRVEYKGGSFDWCVVTGMRFDLNVLEATQTLTASIECPNYPVRAVLETSVVFATEISKDFVGQYYGSDINIFYFVDGNSTDYRRLVFAALDVISTDSLSILDGNRINWLSLSTRADLSSGEPFFRVTTTMARNGTSSMFQNNTMGDVELYRPTIVNLMRTVQHAVLLDLGNAGPGNIFTNASAINGTFSPNPPFNGFDSAVSGPWVGKNAFSYGFVEAPYLTFAEMLRAGVPTNITAALGNLSGLPKNSTMITNYMCPTYQARPIKSFLANIFIGTATMVLSAWAAWKFITEKFARRIQEPCVTCSCGATLDPENAPVRCNHHHAVVTSGLATGLVPPPPDFPTRSNADSVIDEKGDSSSQDISVQEVPKTGPVVEGRIQ
ncbi:hypothetical protein RSOLAG22IIIB_00135 [Rhizoctonia solani]|uniref:Transmembrane protein n=1 Tax=Rhizoctonia solani TaxID=456999 RepID=A0A0K6FKC7_9AGAM|nr:hypothetical protein RSOLAG22IIIB_00135 [Rhizoctonia solani]